MAACFGVYAGAGAGAGASFSLFDEADNALGIGALVVCMSNGRLTFVVTSPKTRASRPVSDSKIDKLSPVLARNAGSMNESGKPDVKGANAGVDTSTSGCVGAW